MNANKRTILIVSLLISLAYCSEYVIVPFQDTYTPHDSPFCEGTQFAATSPSLIISNTIDSLSRGFIDFDISNVTLPLYKAVIELHISSPISLTSQRLNFHVIDPTVLWHEDLACIEEPHMNPTPFASIKIIGKKQIVLEVTPILLKLVEQEYSQFGIAVLADNTRVAISSRESSAPPHLRITM